MVHAILQGGLGNQLYILANLIAYSKRHGFEYCAPDHVINPHSTDKELHKFPGVNYCNWKDTGNMVNGEVVLSRKYVEPHFHYTEIPKIEYTGHLLFSGYFQSYKFFDDYRDEVLKAFGFDDIETKEGVCSLHYRAGDFKQFSDFHPIITREYVALALGNMWFRGIKKFIVFSDDIPDIKQMINTFGWFKDLDFEYSEGRSAIEDLRLMASCSSQICANSTFSSWAAYINPNPNKIVIQPKKWFGESVKHDTSDLYLPNSLIL